MSRVVTGQVMHRRHLPVENRFVYPVFYLLMDLDKLNELASWVFGVNQWRPLAFFQKDHGDGGDPRQWAERMLEQHGVDDCDGSIQLQTFPRVFGFVFNPVSFWFCYRRDQTLGAIIAEVNNTFGDRHCYVLRSVSGSGEFRSVPVEKQFYVSPFYPVSGEYRFTFGPDPDQPRAQIDYHDQGQLQLNTAIWGKTRPWSKRALLSALLRQPLLTFSVVARIHWQALRLWFRGVSFISKPSTSAEEARR